MQLATAAGPAPMNIGAVLVLSADAGLRVERARQLIGERICVLPRMRQRLHRAPPGCGRPYWADDPAFDVRHHVRQVVCPAPGDERALLDVAAALIVRPLPRSRPLWSATIVTGLADGGYGLVFVMDHVLADGIGGLGVLARLADEKPGPSAAGVPVPYPAPAPTAGVLAADAWTERAARLAHLGDGVRAIRQGLVELDGVRPPGRMPPTSLNRPTGPLRRLDVVSADLAAIRDLGHACGGTVNDVILAAVAGALRALLASRGERLNLVTISAPVSGRQSDTAAVLGNQVGTMLVTFRTDGGLADRVTRAAAVTRERKRAARGASAGLLGPLFRLLAAAGLLRWFFNHQRLIHTFVTNLRGPAGPLTLDGVSLRAVLPVPETTGNIPVTFAALSYAGTLWLTVLSDPALVPDVAVLTAALGQELRATAAGTRG
jgi:diacylglycerol O-acyltransferase / wax synthase